MATPSTVNHLKTSHFANMWNGSEDEDYRMFLDLQMDYCNDNMDPMYKIFLEHLREDGHSYILEMADADSGLQTFVKYEGENESASEDVDIEPQGSSENLSDVRKRGRADKFSYVNEVQRKEEAKTVSSPLDFESRLRTAHSLVDESYQTFLRHVRFEDFSMILEWDSRIVRYEGENGALNTSEGLTTDVSLCNGEQGLVTYGSLHCGSHVSELDDSPMVTCTFGDATQFKRQLNAILNQPFDQKEYELLLRDATDRKPLKKQKHLRSMSISYATQFEGLSYLDHYPDLAEQLESADCQKRLELLRGFFFWLKNLCHEGAFMPWLPVPNSSDALLASGYELMLPPNHTGDETEGAFALHYFLLKLSWADSLEMLQ